MTMKKATRLMMLILSYSPIATVAVAAQAKANEIDGEIQTQKVQEIANSSRSLILQPGEMVTSMENAKNLYASKTGLQGVELEQSMSEHLAAMAKAGLIQYNEKAILASGPSEHVGL